jgi:hypothetical protein
MSTLEADAELLKAVIEGRIELDEARVQELFRRRPELNTLAAACRDAEGALDLSALRAGASEDDRRVVAECLSAARVANAGDVGSAGDIAPAVRKRPRSRAVAIALALAAAVLLAFVVRLAWPSRAPAPGGTMLGPSTSIHCKKPVGDSSAFDTFEWTFEEPLEPRGDFLLTIWERAADGTRGAKRFEQTTRLEHLEIPPATSASWPDEILWRVEVRDQSGFPGASCESSARRSR